MTFSVIPVTAERTYDVTVGRGCVTVGLGEAIAETARRVAIIHPPTLRERAEQLRETIVSDDRSVIIVEVPDGERAKTHEVAAYCWQALGQSGFTRTDVVVGFGGGSTTDLAGFVAATWLRGVPLIQVPSTLLAMVDAAVGGKTGINTGEGKNLVGCFYSPITVLCDLELLDSMVGVDLVAGLAEVIKCGFIRDPRILEVVESNPQAAQDPRSPIVDELVRRAVQVKADVVSGDFRESVEAAQTTIGRELLNYGHTFAHAIERVERYQWRHGAAVSVGMCFAAWLSAEQGSANRELVERHYDLLQSVGLPTTYQPGRFEELLAAMRLDKKARGDSLRFIGLADVAEPVLLEDVAVETVSRVYERLCEYRSTSNGRAR